MSELLELIRQHRQQAEDLRARCPHKKKDIKLWLDSSCVGCGTAYPSINIVCKNCGTRKFIFRTHEEVRKKKKPRLTLKLQGFKDERLSYTDNQWELGDRP